MRTYTVNVGNYPLKEFVDINEARKFMVQIHLDQQAKCQALDYIDEAVLKSDLSESKALINHIMEMR